MNFCLLKLKQLLHTVDTKSNPQKHATLTNKEDPEGGMYCNVSSATADNLVHKNRRNLGT